MTTATQRYFHVIPNEQVGRPRNVSAAVAPQHAPGYRVPHNLASYAKAPAPVEQPTAGPWGVIGIVLGALAIAVSGLMIAGVLDVVIALVAVPFAVVALVLGCVGLARARKVDAGKGASVTAIVLGGVGTLAAVASVGTALAIALLFV